MKYVYVVMGGCVTDYHVISIHSSEKKAVAEIEKINADKWGKQLEPYIEKWELNKSEY